mgnify:CR=1 FL=1
MLVQYFRRGGVKKMRTGVRDNQIFKKRGLGGGIRKGVFVALEQEGELKFGWSLCNVRAGDIFDEAQAMTIAIGRASKYGEEFLTKCPFSMQKKAKRFLARAHVYFDKEEE